MGKGKVPRVVIKRNPCLRVGTWNVRSMLKKGKLGKVKRELAKCGLNISGLSEVRWKDNGDFISDQFRIMYDGGRESQREVAVVGIWLKELKR